MNILVASNFFKECASSEQVNDAIERGIDLFLPFHNKNLEIKKIEICDDGTGFASILAKATKGEIIECPAVDPLNRPITSFYGVDKHRKTAFIEVAQTAGLGLLKKEEQNPVNATSYGVGLQLNNAIQNFQVDKIFVGCGDTAINDFGIGMLAALGVEFRNNKGKVLDPSTPRDIMNIQSITYNKSELINYINRNVDTVARIPVKY